MDTVKLCSAAPTSHVQAFDKIPIENVGVQPDGQLLTLRNQRMFADAPPANDESHFLSHMTSPQERQEQLAHMFSNDIPSSDRV